MHLDYLIVMENRKWKIENRKYDKSVDLENIVNKKNGNLEDVLFDFEFKNNLYQLSIK